ncbi:MAG: hypothetical protein ABFD50_18145 [Smithella sp.]
MVLAGGGDVTHSRKIKNGKVKWLSSIDDNSLGCGKGVASVTGLDLMA